MVSLSRMREVVRGVGRVIAECVLEAGDSERVDCRAYSVLGLLAARRACMPAISSGLNPISASEADQVGGRPAKASSTWTLCWKFHGIEMDGSSAVSGGKSPLATEAGDLGVFGRFPSDPNLNEKPFREFADGGESEVVEGPSLVRVRS